MVVAARRFLVPAALVLVVSGCAPFGGEAAAADRAIDEVRSDARRGVSRIEDLIELGAVAPGDPQIAVELGEVPGNELIEETPVDGGTAYLMTYSANGVVGGGWVGSEAQARLCATVTVADDGTVTLADATCPDAILERFPDAVVTDLGR